MIKKNIFIEKIFLQSENEEYAQAILRLFVLIPFFFLFLIKGLSATIELEPFLIHTCLTIYGISYFFWIKNHSAPNTLRRYIAIFIDISMVSFAILYAEWIGFLLYPLYLWIIVGNGMRYGKNYVYSGILFAFLEFGVLLFVNDFWTDNFNIGLGLLLVIVILPLFFLIMTHRLQLANEKLQEQLKIQKNQEMILIQQSRHAAMGEMISNIAHQWRQPLNALGLLLQNIENMYDMDMLDDAYMRKSIDKGTKLTENMSKTIDDFRDFFKPNKEKKTFNISSVITDSLSIMEAAFRHNEIKLVLDLEEESKFYGYPNEFSQAILNVLTNAKDVLVENRTKNATIWVRLFEEKDTAVITIEDNAGGIDLDIIGRVFEPYFTTKEENKGTGIGLYMSKLIIENHLGGSLSVRNSQNGAEFKIVLDVRNSHV